MLAPSWCLIYRPTRHSLSQRGGKTVLDLDRTQAQEQLLVTKIYNLASNCIAALASLNNSLVNEKTRFQ